MSFTAKAARRAKDENELNRSILDASFRVHSALGPGLLESAYEACLAYELRAEGLKVSGKVPREIQNQSSFAPFATFAVKYLD
jgi:GxxExxY protein